MAEPDIDETPRLQEDGTVFPPVTPDPPSPPGYRSPLEDRPLLAELRESKSAQQPKARAEPPD